MYGCQWLTKAKAQGLFCVEVLHSVRELIEDCWDQEAEARISALCAKQRLEDLQALPANALLSKYRVLSISGGEGKAVECDWFTNWGTHKLLLGLLVAIGSLLVN